MGLAFIYPALRTCLVIYVQKSDFHLINMFCVVIVVNKKKLFLAQVVFSYFVLHSSKIQQRIFSFGALGYFKLGPLLKVCDD